MNILFIVPYTPTLIRTRPYNLLRALNRRGHAITLATVWENQEERQALDELSSLGIRVIAAPLSRPRILLNLLQAFFSGVPLQQRYSWNPVLARELPFEIRRSKFDLVHLEHLRGALYGLYLKSYLCHCERSSRSNPLHSSEDCFVAKDAPRNDSMGRIPIVYDAVDCISLLFEQAMRTSHSRYGRWITRFELPRTRHYEGWLTTQFDQILITSPIDRKHLLGLVNTGHEPAPISVLPNGVDLSYFKPLKPVKREPNSIVLSGKMSYHANITMAIYLVNVIMPMVWVKNNSVKVYIVGKDPPSQVLALGENPKVVITGTVFDIRPYIQNASLAVVPMVYGAGSQFKILEAMACGTPVVASLQAISSLDNVIPGKDLLVGDGPMAMAQAIQRLLEDQHLRNYIGDNGLAYVHRYHDWNAIVAQLEEIYLNALSISKM